MRPANLAESGLISLIVRSSPGIALPQRVVRSAWAIDMQYRILGPFVVAKDGVEVVIGSGKQRALLVLLLLHANEAVSTDRLIDHLWSESRSKSATKVLQNYVSRLRRLLGEGALITRTHGYELRVERGELDADCFDDLVSEGRRALAAGDPERAWAHLAEALALWRGPALADFAYEPFAVAEIERLEGRRLTAVTERIEADLRLGRHEALIGELEALVGRHPLQERLRGQLMLALYRSGRQAEALQVYRATRGVLVHELGIEPSKELQRLEQAILVHDPVLDPPPVTGSAVSGAHRSRPGLVAGALLLAIAISTTAILVAGRHGGNATAALPAIGAIDPKTNKLVDAVPVENFPTRIAAGMGQVWALSSGSFGGTLSMIDSRSLTVATHAVNDVRGALTSVALGTQQGWVTYNGTLAMIGPTGFVTRIPFERNGDGDVSDVAAGRDATWVASRFQHGVVKVDRSTLRVVAKVRTPALPLAVAAAGEGVWVAGLDTSSRAGVLMRIDPTRDMVAATIPLPGIPTDLAAGYGGVWVIVNSENAVWHVDAATGAVVRTIPVGSGPVALAVGAGSVWVVNAKDGTVSRIDPRTNEIAATISIGGSPRDVAVGGGRVWVAML